MEAYHIKLRPTDLCFWCSLGPDANGVRSVAATAAIGKGQQSEERAQPDLADHRVVFGRTPGPSLTPLPVMKVQSLKNARIYI